jgi:diguanylate cyclase (GGDEF)-like protein
LRGRDALTGLVTRPEFETVLDEAVQQCHRTGTPLAVLYLGLDNFRFINEAYGLRVGDALLVQAAQRITAVLGDGHAAARMGGDEFALLLPGAMAEADTLATTLQQRLQAPFTVESLSLQLSASVGRGGVPGTRLAPPAAGARGAGHAFGQARGRWLPRTL